ncbi:Carboxyvinyl-carboxyphosphonate phosphorylmutase, chloroplastic [Geodia barretti]|uniref:Carboxyvinyl-carboxyphosphonate phosphorylmutase, chloroplastic n=1 Tax=Geodia barretti TaxID=519541 RepID=A0AA35T0U6_GEOBA|nr:Carboxyvinyl-carboxyphosphonate phosphorylmutase, chloroplastic [Geodia barretti]
MRRAKTLKLQITPVPRQSVETIKQILRRDGPLVVPGVYDAMGAKIVQKVGFDAMFQTGYGTSATLFGMPDYGFIGAAETTENARRICKAVSLPVIVDADTGYGNALSVWKLVRDLESAGASGIFLEDQRWPKRCGHMNGKEVIPQAEYAEKLQAAVDARDSEDFVIVARTDARATEGIDAAIERGRQNRKIGADVIFIEAPRSIDEMKQIGREIKAPLVANMIEGGATPISSAEDLYSMGFKIILYPLSVLFASSYAAMGVLRELRLSGTTKKLEGNMVDFEQFNDLVDLSQFRELEERYGSV